MTETQFQAEVTPTDSLPMRIEDVGGLAFAYHESGQKNGTNVVLLHSGEFGACASTSWVRILPLLQSEYRVIAPDWLGYGDSAKVFDFENNTRLRLRLLRDGLDKLGVEDAHFVGTSLGGTMLLHALLRKTVDLPMRSASLLSSGGPMPASAARQTLTDFDGSRESMRAIIATMFHDARWANSEEYLDYRWELSRRPGAWESVAAARFKRPDAEMVGDFGRPDSFEYENMPVPTLALGGADDKLKPEGYLEMFVPRIPDGRSVLLSECGHCPNVEHPDKVAHALRAFFAEVEGRS